MSAESEGFSSGVGSILLLDSLIANTQVGVNLRNTPAPTRTDVSGTLLLDNVQVTNVNQVIRNSVGKDFWLHN